MAEGDTPTPPVVHEGMSKEEVKEELARHRREIEDMYAKHRTELLDEINSLGAGDKAQRDALDAELKDLKAWKDQQIKSQQEAQAGKGDHHTIVTPPANIPPPPTAPVGEGSSGDNSKRRMSWW